MSSSPTALRRICRMLFGLAACGPGTAPAMTELAENELAGIAGQAMFLADRIIGPGANGTPDDGNAFNNFTFYRVALDADILMNMNINKLQLGCGGFNEGLVANACDVDLDFATFMGTGGIGSDFQLQRPYLELAVKNDTDKTRRELVGLKIGTALADGILSIGRVYANGQTNQENGGTCGNPNAAEDYSGARVACHSGANRISGFLNAEISGYGRIDDPLFGTAEACAGVINAPNGCNNTSPMFASISGTRMNEILVVNKTLRVGDCTGLLWFICGGSPYNGVADLRENVRFLHTVRLNDSGPVDRVSRDFFISFQRERVAYPIFDQSTPYATAGYGTANSAYSVAANTGWWMNVTYASALNLNLGTLSLNGSLGAAIDALNEGANLHYITLNQNPADNCYGAATFC